MKYSGFDQNVFANYITNIAALLFLKIGCYILFKMKNGIHILT